MSTLLADAGIQLSNDSKKAFHIAQRIATEYNHATYSGPHLLKALLHPDFAVRNKLLALEKDIFYIEDWAEIRLDDLSKQVSIHEPVADEQILQLLSEAEILKIEAGDDEITPHVLFAALTIPGLAFNYDQLKTFPVAKSEWFQPNPGMPVSGGKNLQNSGVKTGSGASGINRFVIHKNSEEYGTPVIGRDKELRLCFEILSRKAKPNVLMIGEPGVGKSALINGLALNIQQLQAPGRMQHAQLFEVDMGALQLGTGYKGEVEDRFVKLLDEIREFEQPVVIIEDIHQLLDKNKGLDGIAAYARSEMSKGEITFIGTTTTDQYRKTLEKDEGINRRFEPMFLKEPDENTAVQMISATVPAYEEHHGFTVGHEEIEEAVRMARRYIKDRQLPDSALDLIDRTMASLRMVQDTSQLILDNLEKEWQNVSEANDEITWPEKASAFYAQLNNQISPLLFHRVGELPAWIEGVDERAQFNGLKVKLDEIGKTFKEYFNNVSIGDLAIVVAERTGVPVGNVQTQERERLLDMETHLQTRVIGQNHAIHSIAEAVIESRSGLTKGKQPIGSFFFLGPTGTGKTELAKTLAEFLFGNEQAMIRFDMSEFKEEHSAALLYGAPPGYVGYEEGGMLVNRIRQQPYAVVLFDEIEKAHASVFDIFLQILDEGKLNDRLGRTGDFTNAIILFTSNIGSDHIVKSFAEGKIPASTSLLDIMGNYFRPEFLGRLTEIVPFSPVSENMVVRILDIQLAELKAMLEVKGITLVVSDDAKTEIARAGYTPKYGARPLKGVVRDWLRRPLSRMIVAEKIKAGDTVTCSPANEPGENLQWEIKSDQ